MEQHEVNQCYTNQGFIQSRSFQILPLKFKKIIFCQTEGSMCTIVLELAGKLGRRHLFVFPYPLPSFYICIRSIPYNSAQEELVRLFLRFTSVQTSALESQVIAGCFLPPTSFLSYTLPRSLWEDNITTNNSPACSCLLTKAELCIGYSMVITSLSQVSSRLDSGDDTLLLETDGMIHRHI